MRCGITASFSNHVNCNDGKLARASQHSVHVCNIKLVLSARFWWHETVLTARGFELRHCLPAHAQLHVVICYNPVPCLCLSPGLILRAKACVWIVVYMPSQRLQCVLMIRCVCVTSCFVQV